MRSLEIVSPQAVSINQRDRDIKVIVSGAEDGSPCRWTAVDVDKKVLLTAKITATGVPSHVKQRVCILRLEENASWPGQPSQKQRIRLYLFVGNKRSLKSLELLPSYSTVAVSTSEKPLQSRLDHQGGAVFIRRQSGDTLVFAGDTVIVATVVDGWSPDFAEYLEWCVFKSSTAGEYTVVRTDSTSTLRKHRRAYLSSCRVPGDAQPGKWAIAMSTSVDMHAGLTFVSFVVKESAGALQARLTEQKLASGKLRFVDLQGSAPLQFILRVETWKARCLGSGVWYISEKKMVICANGSLKVGDHSVRWLAAPEITWSTIDCRFIVAQVEDGGSFPFGWFAESGYDLSKLPWDKIKVEDYAIPTDLEFGLSYGIPALCFRGDGRLLQKLSRSVAQVKSPVSLMALTDMEMPSQSENASSAPIRANGSYTLKHPIRPSGGTSSVELHWLGDSLPVSGLGAACSWKDTTTGAIARRNGICTAADEVSCFVPNVNNTLKDFLLFELTINESLIFVYETWQSEDGRTLRVYDVNFTSLDMQTFTISMPISGTPIIESGYGVRTKITISGSFVPYVSDLWYLGCSFNDILQQYEDVLVEGTSQNNSTKLECLLPSNFTHHEFASSLHIIALKIDDPHEVIARFSGSNPLPFVSAKIFTIKGATPSWGLAGLTTEVTIYGGDFPPADFIELLCHFEGIGYTRASRSNETTIACPTPEAGQSPKLGSRLTVMYDTTQRETANWRAHEASSLSSYPTVSYDQYEIPVITSISPASRQLYPLSQNNTRRLRITHAGRLPWIMLWPNSVACEFSPSLGAPTQGIAEAATATVVCPVPMLAMETNVTDISISYRINGSHIYTPIFSLGHVASFDIIPRPKVIRLVRNSSVHLQLAPMCGSPRRFIAVVEAANTPSRENRCSVVLVPPDGVLPGRLTGLSDGTFQCNVPIVVPASLQTQIESTSSNKSDFSAYVIIGQLDVLDLQNDDIRNHLLHGSAEVPVVVARGIRNSSVTYSSLALNTHARRLREGTCADGSWDMWRRASSQQPSISPAGSALADGYHVSKVVAKAPDVRKLVHVPANETEPAPPPPKDWFNHNVSLNAVSPDWSFSNGGGSFLISGTFIAPSIYNFSGFLVNFGNQGPRVSAHLVNESTLSFVAPAMPDNFFDMIELSITVIFLSPFNGTHVNLTANHPGLMFSYLPSFSLGGLQPRAGPPGGLTNLTMRVMFYANFSSGLERELGLEFDCAIGWTRSPATFTLANPLDLAALAMTRSYEVWCEAPMAGPRRDVCVQLVPRRARYVVNPLQPCNNTAGLHRLEYNYYRQVPRVDHLSPSVGLFEGGASVVVSGKNFPSNITFPYLPTALCRLDIYISHGLRIDNSSVLCEAPALSFFCNSSIQAPDCPDGYGVNGTIGVPVTLSFNGGRDWSFSSVNFTYVPRSSIIGIFPTFGPVTGGTKLSVSVASTHYAARKLCVGDQVVPVTPKAYPTNTGLSGITDYEATVPALAKNGTTSIEVWTVGVSIMQGDGRCFMGDRNFTYVAMWKVHNVEPAQGVLQRIRDPAALLISGSNFYMSLEARCRFSISMMINGSAFADSDHNTSAAHSEVSRYGATSTRALADFIARRACDIEVEANVLDWNRLMCGPEFGVDFIDRTVAACGGDILAAALSSEPRYMIVLSSLSMSISVAMNGVDYAPAVTAEAGKAWTLLYSIFLAPSVVGIEPGRGPDAGGYPIRFVVSGSVVWRVTSCRFEPAHVWDGVATSESNDTPWVDVPATPVSDREVICVAPRWHIEPGRDASLVNISMQITSTLWTNVTQFTYVKSPEIESVSPAEGHSNGGTRVTIYGKGFNLFDPEVLGSSDMRISCVFGRTAVAAHYISPTELYCYSPPSTFSDTQSGHYVNLDLTLAHEPSHPSLRVPSVSLVPLYQQLFYYRGARFSVTYASPLSGPRTGGTRMSIYSDEPFLNTGLLRCAFGKQLVPAQWVSPFRIDCSSPSVNSPGAVKFGLSSDNQTITPLTVVDPTSKLPVELQFTYYIGATVASVSPSFGGTDGGTVVLLQGSHFADYSDLSCRFGTTVVPVLRFISSSAILCKSPAHQMGAIVVGVANNGQDFTGGAGTVYTYINSKPAFIITPFLGPISGNTRVTVRASDTDTIPPHIWRAASSSSYCSFGTLKAEALVDDATATLYCISPKTTEPGEVTLLISLNGQDTAAATQKYYYYAPPFISLVEPPMGPQGQSTFITLTGGNFYNTDMLTVKFGGVSSNNEDSTVALRRAIWLSNSQLQVESPDLAPGGQLRVPLYVSNNDQNFSPEGIGYWDADDDSHDEAKSLRYYTFHLPIIIKGVYPQEGNMHGGGLISVHGGPFIATAELLCSFDWVYIDRTVARPVVVSPTQLLCPVPDMWDARSANALNREARVRITLNGIDWSLTDALFTFKSMSPPGYFTHHLEQSIFTSQIRPCPSGHMCEETGLSQPMPCPPGTYQPRGGSRQCLDCPMGYYCPTARMEKAVVCPAGWICDEEGLVSPYKRCPAGFMCQPGTAAGSATPVQTIFLESNNPTIYTAGFNAPKLCPRGLHCYAGTSTLRSSPGNLSTPQPCFQGFFCPPGSSKPYGAGACPPGKYCPVPRSAGITCPSRFKCGPMPGQFEPTKCPAGSYNPYHGQHNCTLCNEGGICPVPMMERPKPAECGYVAARKGIKVHSGNDLCPAGRVCGWGVASVTEPKICSVVEASSIGNMSFPEDSCLPELGEAYVTRERARLLLTGGDVANRLNNSLGLCCWTSGKVLQFLSGIASHFENLQVPLLDEARAAWTLVHKVRSLNERETALDSSATGFDGLAMLLNFTDDSLRLSWELHLSRVRRRILLDIARRFYFNTPKPCPKGSFCNTGTCEDLMVVVSDSGQTSSGRRRLEAVVEDADGITRRKALADTDIAYFNMPKADIVRMSDDDQQFVMIQLGAQRPRVLTSADSMRRTRLLQTTGSEEVQRVTLPPNHPLALRAPQQCLAGTYCNARANSSLGTGLCPTGMYCSSGASEPAPAPEGEFVGETGRVRGRMCTPGKFAPQPSSPICYPCPPGYSCPDFGTRTPFICSRGTFRLSSGGEAGSAFDDETPVVVDESGGSSSGSISCSPCVAGTWSALRGTEDETGCDPCPAGRFCLAKTGNLSETNPCPEGNICGEGTTLETASKVLCFDGFFCGPGTSPTSVYQSLCLKEFYCPQGTTFANRYNFRCPTGFYCPAGTGWKPDMDVPLRPNSAYLKYIHFHILQVVGQYCLRQLHAAEYNYIQYTNDARRRSGLAEEMPRSEVQVRLSKWTTSMLNCVHSQIEYIPLLADGVEGVTKELFDEETWHSESILTLQPWKLAHEYSNKCLNDTYPRVRSGSTWDCLCTSEPAGGELMKCLTSSVDPYEEPHGAPFRYDGDGELTSSSCSPWPDCIDWSRVSQDNIGGSAGPEGGPFWDDFDRLAVPFIDYVRAALEREMKRTALAVDEAGRSQQSRTRCPFGTLTSEDAESELELCVKRKSIVHLEDNADIVISRINPVAMANVDSVPRPIPPSMQGKIIPVIDDEDERVVYSLPARGSAVITLDLRHLPFGVEYGRDWRMRIVANDTLPHDFDDSQVCENIWARWYLDKELYYGSLADVREDDLREHNCTALQMPIALEKFMMASGSLCPSSTDPLCLGFGFTQSISTAVCSSGGPGQSPTGQPKVIELQLHALVDIQFRVEVQMLNGMTMADRFNFIQTASVEILQPARNVLNTSNAFVIELRHDSQVALPFNTPLASPDRKTNDLDVKYSDLAKQSSISGATAISQRGVLNKAFLSWLPRDQSLTNCMRHPADYDEYLWAGQYFTNIRKTVWMSHIPFFSNCRGFGRAIPLWQVVEHGEKCRIVDEQDTVAIDRLSFGALASGDYCGPSDDGSTSPVRLTCIIDEKPNEKLLLPRWFEGQSGSILFYISRRALTSIEYASIGEPMPDAIPIVLTRGATSDGKLMRSVKLDLKYWQRTSKEKVLIKGEVEFSKFETPTAQQLSGEALWEYTLEINWEGMSHIGVMNSFAFPWDFYLISFTATSFLLLSVMLLFWGYNWTFSLIKFPPKITDSRYIRLICKPVVKGAVLAILPCAPTLMLLIMFVRGTIGDFSLPFFECAEGTSIENCAIGIFDNFLTSWNGETRVTETTAQQRRRARSGVALLTVGAYIAVQSVKAFLPAAESKFYATGNNGGGIDALENIDEESEDDEGNEGRMKEEIADDSELPSDEPIFIPHIWKRTCFALILFGMAVVALILLQFSFSQLFMDNLWLMLLGLYLFGIISEVILNTFVAERLLLVPAVNVVRLLSSLAMLASKDFFTFILTQFVVLAIQTVDRMYISPNKAWLLSQAYNIAVSTVNAIKWVLKGGDESDVQAKIRSTMGGGGSQEEDDLIDALGNPIKSDEGIGMISGFNIDDEGVVDEPIEQYDTRVEDMIGFLAGLGGFHADDLPELELIRVSPAYLNWAVYLMEIMSRGFQRALQAGLEALRLLQVRLVPFLAQSIAWHSGIGASSARMYCKGEPFDDTVAPHLRSIDLMCFSEQYYFCCYLNGLGIITWIVGLQIILANRWNIFDDPASAMVFVLSIAVCKLGQTGTITTANYLKLWQVNEAPMKYPTATVAALTAAATRQQDSPLVPLVKIPAPPRSALAFWPEPSEADAHNLERYREAFVKENQLWLQHSFDELLKDDVLVKHRKALLKSIAGAIGEVDPDEYNPASGSDLQQRARALPPKTLPTGEIHQRFESTNAGTLAQNTVSRAGYDVTNSVQAILANDPQGFQFDAPPPHTLALGRAARRRFAHESTAAAELSLLWVRRARFLLYLRRSTNNLRPSQYRLRDRCDLCDNDRHNGRGLCLTPIYTLVEIASEYVAYRRQREVSPFWNAPLWERFYTRYTPTCTLCSLCHAYYWKRNINVPIDNRRRATRGVSNQRRTPLDVLADSPYSQLQPPPRVDRSEAEVLLQWLQWAERRRSGDDWRGWISDYGHERPLPLEHDSITNQLANDIIMKGRAAAEQVEVSSDSSDDTSSVSFSVAELRSASAQPILLTWLAKAKVAVSNRPSPLPPVAERWLALQQNSGGYAESSDSSEGSGTASAEAGLEITEYAGDARNDTVSNDLDDYS
ncbi:hypothetical protein FOL47_003034 [Perkinsus chesapeaki]|uniref:IPT/TIG domain-containing protein n=1 Tax=Perkinsus chesapeaki TaxID=330153 RepID=A0A7J6MBR3_PERCH|nr:hypothetical protein FOL47_003034 [Perkinsus chesapeaki]